MIEFAGLPPLAQATALVGVVFLQAVALYVGYGILERVASPLIDRVTSASA
ncbi:hypothetical protein [Natronococcus sp. A-GB7]|jgi:hypothetical protein|uniref:DUF7512 family protein n=1 Tax=Natronococcus sp. A-GB7 TaxID=3037649 RepID=UPI00241F5419|nr:hypothetical protein [Natronococcus sp. A-GB7]MDG5818572.1 hypothetical protein [Natronococcus sp. A-GB7]